MELYKVKDVACMNKFKSGDRVIVTSDCDSYNQVGTVNSYQRLYGYMRVQVMLDNGSIKYYKEDSLRLLDVNEGGIGVTVNGNYNIAWVQFVQGTNTTKEYAFALFDKGCISVGDLVLCDSSNGYGVAKVTKIMSQEECNIPVMKEIICKVDFTAFEKRKELRRQKEALKKQMDKMVADNQELILYQAIADKNPEMAAMLMAYKALSDV